MKDWKVAKVLLHTIGFVALLHLAAIGLTYLGISNNPLIHMFVIEVVVIMAGDFVMKAWLCPKKVERAKMGEQVLIV